MQFLKFCIIVLFMVLGSGYFGVESNVGGGGCEFVSLDSRPQEALSQIINSYVDKVIIYQSDGTKKTIHEVRQEWKAKFCAIDSEILDLARKSYSSMEQDQMVLVKEQIMICMDEREDIVTSLNQYINTITCRPEKYEEKFLELINLKGPERMFVYYDEELFIVKMSRVLINWIRTRVENWHKVFDLICKRMRGVKGHYDNMAEIQILTLTERKKNYSLVYSELSKRFVKEYKIEEIIKSLLSSFKMVTDVIGLNSMVDAERVFADDLAAIKKMFVSEEDVLAMIVDIHKESVALYDEEISLSTNEEISLSTNASSFK